MRGGKWALAGAVVGLVASLVLWAVSGFPLREAPMLPMIPLILAGFFLVLRGRMEFTHAPRTRDEASKTVSYMLPGALLIGLGCLLYVLAR